jgi:hypothetical protein
MPLRPDKRGPDRRRGTTLFEMSSRRWIAGDEIYRGGVRSSEARISATVSSQYSFSFWNCCSSVLSFQARFAGPSRSMLNLSAGEGRDTSALGTIHGDWSLPLVEAICTPYKVRASIELSLRYYAGMTTLRHKVQARSI